MVNLRKAAMTYLYEWLSCLELLQLYEVKACVNYHKVSDAIRRSFRFVVTKLTHTTSPIVVRCLLLLCVSSQLYLDDLTSRESVNWLACDLNRRSLNLYGNLLD